MKNKEISSPNPEDTFQNNEAPTPCDNCEAVAPEFIELKCNHAFCLLCLAQDLLREGRTSPRNELACLKCPSITSLDENSITALESAIQKIFIQQNFKNQALLKREYFREVIVEESRETFFTEDIAMSKSQANTGENAFIFFRNSGQAASGGTGDSTNVSFPSRKSGQGLENSRGVKGEDELHREWQNENKRELKPEAKGNLFVNEEGKECSKAEPDCEGAEAPFKVPLQSLALMCRSHTKEKRTLFCFTCESPPFCVECLIEGKHQAHLVRSIEKCQNYLRDKSEDLALTVKREYDACLHELSKLEERISSHTNQCNNIKEYFSLRFQEIFSAIARKKNALSAENARLRDFHRQGLLMELEKLEKSRGKLSNSLADLEFKQEAAEADFLSLKNMHDSISQARSVLQQHQRSEPFTDLWRVPREAKFSALRVDDCLMRAEIKSLRPVRFTNAGRSSKPLNPKSTEPEKVLSEEPFRPANTHFADYFERNKLNIKSDQKKTYKELLSRLEFLGLSKSKERPVFLGPAFLSPASGSYRQRRGPFEPSSTRFYQTISSKLEWGSSSRKNSPDLIVTNLSKRY